MNDLDPKDPDEKCNARRTDGSGYCKQPAGWGTDHQQGRCKFHGGATPDHEKHIIDELEDAAEHASTAFKLRLKHIRRQVENGDHDEIDWQELDRLGRNVLDRTGHGKGEKHEHTGELNIGGAFAPDNGSDE